MTQSEFPISLQDPAKPLDNFGEALGIQPRYWRNHREDLNQISARSGIEVWIKDGIEARLQVVTATLALIDAYGAALDASLSKVRPEEATAQGFDDFSDERETDFPIKPGLDSKKLESFLSSIPSGAKLALSIQIDKQILAMDLLGKKKLQLPKNARLGLIFFQETLQGLFEDNLDHLETWWDKDKSEKFIILCPSWSGHLDGSYLAVLGGNPSLTWPKTAVAAPSQNGVEEPSGLSPLDLYQNCRKYLKWQKEWLTHLTPLHLQVKGSAPPMDPVAAALCIQWIKLCFLFTADSSNEDPSTGQMIFTYEGGGDKVEILAPPFHSFDKTGMDAAIALTELMEWAYTKKFAIDRLNFLQSAVARSLNGIDPTTRFEILVQNAGYIWEQIEPDWKMFIEGKLDEFGNQARALEDYVADTVRTFSDQIAAMIKGLSETMLAAVAVLLGAFLATLFSKDLKPEILRVSVSIYLIYLLVFPLMYNMSQQSGNYRALVWQFTERRKRFVTSLSESKVNHIIGNHITTSKDRFGFWFRWIVGAYLLVAILLGMLICPAFSLLPLPSDTLTSPRAPVVPAGVSQAAPATALSLDAFLSSLQSPAAVPVAKAANSCGSNFCTQAQRDACIQQCLWQGHRVFVGLECCSGSCTTLCICGSVPVGC